MGFSESQNKIFSALRSASYLPVALPVVIAALVYLNSLSHEFVFDDMATIVENKYIKNFGDQLPSFFNSTYFKISGEASYRPVATLSYYGIYAICGRNPFGYHLSSVLLHIVNVVLVYGLVNFTQRRKFAALVAALVFACHPVLTEAVNCISFNEDLLTTLFFLTSVILYIRISAAVKRQTLVPYFLSLLAFLLALLSKEMAITLPAILFLYDITHVPPTGRLSFIRRTFRHMAAKKYYYAGYIALSGFFLALRFILLTDPKAAVTPPYGLLERMLYLPYHLVQYVKLVLWPATLTADYVYAYPRSFFDIGNIAALGMLSILLGSSFYIYKNSKMLFWGIGWFFISLLPVANIIPITNPIAERYLYLPTVGLCIAVAALLVIGQNKLAVLSEAKLIAFKMVIVIFIAAVYAPMTVIRNRDWRDSFSLWSATLKTSPHSSGAHSNLGRVYLEQDLLDQAIAEFQAAIQLTSRAYKAHHNLGVAFEKKGLVQEAIQEYKKTIDIHPDHSDAHFNLGNLYAQQGYLEEAAAAYRQAVRLDPDDVEARNNLGVVYARQGKLSEAIQEWQIVLTIDPQNQNAAENLNKAKTVLN